MTSQKQIEANRRNASKSTGPKSEAGKARSKLNSLKHGLLAKAVVLPGEDELEFEGLVQALALELGPNGVLEEQLVGCIAANFWRLRRIYQIESEFFEFQRAVIEYLNAKDRLKVIEANSGEDAMMQRAVMGIHPDDPWHKSATDEVNKTQSKVQNMSTGLGAIFKNDADNSDALGKLARYETGKERSLFQAMHELQRLQESRKNWQAIVPTAVDVTLNRPPVRHRSRPKTVN